MLGIFDWSLYVGPTLEVVHPAMGRMTDAAPGLDGARYSAYWAGGPVAIDAPCSMGDLIQVHCLIVPKSDVAACTMCTL